MAIEAQAIHPEAVPAFSMYRGSFSDCEGKLGCPGKNLIFRLARLSLAPSGSGESGLRQEEGAAKDKRIGIRKNSRLILAVSGREGQPSVGPRHPEAGAYAASPSSRSHCIRGDPVIPQPLHTRRPRHPAAIAYTATPSSRGHCIHGDPVIPQPEHQL